MTGLRIATRRSALAMAQARRVGEMLEGSDPDLEIRLVEVETSGDRNRTGSIVELTEVGAFVRAVQRAVLDGEADLAVHSLKDLPVANVEGLEIVAFPERHAPWDVMVGTALPDLPTGARVGTGSPRRAAQLLELRPDLKPTELRGNVETRLRRVRSGEVDAAVLAEAGLARLGMGGAIVQRFPVDEMVPAPGQAVLAVEARPDTRAAAVAAAIDDAELRPLVTAERLLLAETGAGCRSALGALATGTEAGIRLECFVADERGARRCRVEADSPDDVAKAARTELRL